MDDQQARNRIKETFEKPFDKARFIFFVKNLLNRIEEETFIYRGQYVPDAYKPYIESLERIGKFTDGENKIDILVINLKKETSLEHARTMQRNFIAWYLNGSRGSVLKDAALAAFVSPDESDWRFSLIKMDYKFEQTKTDRMKVKQEFTPARRWSFLVGANENSHTAQSRLVNILADDEQSPTLVDLEEAFNIETVTKEFFLKYRDLFIRTIEALEKLAKSDAKIQTDFAAKGVNAVDFAKKLLGQIIFLYFLQKKGWFGVNRDAKWGSGSKQFLRELFEKKHANHKNFFNDILEPLFYEALRIDRSYDDGYYSRFNCKIPFLNGGLFDPIGNYDWVHTDICLPDSLFSNKNKTREGDPGDGILDIFDLYNFTVKEDEPLEKEVAIDPELLGKAYEKFNAIRPDNFEEYKKALKSGKKGDETKFNKQFGVYYTPREIVHYMCQQSLINYLFTELNSGQISYEKLDDPHLDMFGNKGKKGQLDITVEHTENPEILKEDIETMIHLGERVSENESIALIKEQRINAGIQKSSKTKLQLSESIRNSALLIDRKLEDITVCDPAVGSGAFPVGMMSEIVKARTVLTTFISAKENRTSYDFKRRCIEHSLYGVDIDPGAAEIAKLRLWLSLVVDEDDIKQIKPLPNLDYKIVCGNSLLGVEKNLFNEKPFNELKKIKPLHFNETNPTKKVEYKKQIDGFIKEITSGHSEFDFEVYFSEVFHEKGGFDVVIANPPYDVVNDQIYRTMYSDSIYGRANLYGLFLHKSVNNLAKPSGYITFINPKTLLSDKYFINLRKLLKNRGNFKTILKIADRHKVFENVLQAVIVNIFQRQDSNNPQDLILMHEIRERSDIEHIEKRLAVKSNKVWLGNRFDFSLLISDKMEIYSIFERVLSEMKSFLQVGIKFTTGKIQWDLFKKQLMAKPVSESFRLIWAENIQRYRFSDSEKRKGREFIKRPLAIQPNITTKTIITQRTTADEQVHRIIATVFDPQQEGYNAFSENHTNYLVRCASAFQIEFLLGLLNSQLFDVVFRHINSNTQVSSGELNSLPIKEFSLSDQSPIVMLVDKILPITKSHDYLQNPAKQVKVSEYERQIDQFVYQLYGLTKEEIKIVENGE